jgi:hypothetical protein
MPSEIDGTPIDDIIERTWGAYCRREQCSPGRMHNRYTAYIKFVYPEGDYSIEEIDVDAVDATDARVIASLAMLRDYMEGGEIIKVEERFGLYM